MLVKKTNKGTKSLNLLNMFISNSIWLLLLLLGLISVILLAWREAFRYKILLSKNAAFKSFLAVLVSLVLISDLIIMVIYTGWLSMLTAAIILQFIGIFILNFFRKRFSDKLNDDENSEMK